MSRVSALAAPGVEWRRTARDRTVAASPYLFLFAVVLATSIAAPGSFSKGQIFNNINIGIVIALVAVGQAFVLMTGGIDLSVGGVIAAVNTFAGTHMGSTGSAWVWVVVLLAFGWLPGAINAALITYGRVQPFIATLGTWFVWGGIAYVLLESPGGSVSADFGNVVVLSTFLGIDTPVWILIVLIVFSLWFIRTRIGVSIRAVGSNAEATALRGVSVRRSIFVAYCLSSFLAVAAGLVQSAQSLSGDPTIGDDFILLSVAAAVIGGTSLLGGRGSAIGAIVGVLILIYMQTLVVALGLRNEWSLIISGCLLIASVGIQRLSTHDER